MTLAGRTGFMAELLMCLVVSNMTIFSKLSLCKTLGPTHYIKSKAHCIIFLCIMYYLLYTMLVE